MSDKSGKIETNMKEVIESLQASELLNFIDVK